MPPRFIGQRVEVRFDKGLTQVRIFFEGKEAALAKEVIMADNARAKRDKSSLSLAGLMERGDR